MEKTLLALGLSRVMTPEIETGLRLTLRNAEKEGYERYGSRLPLLLAIAERA